MKSEENLWNQSEKWIALTDSETFSIKRAFSGYVLKIDYVLEFAYVLK